MAKSKSVYVCQQCGYETGKWLGKCPGCESWNTLVEEIRQPIASASGSAPKRRGTPTGIGELSAGDELRYKTGIGEFDRVLGGGIVKGSMVLLGGDPGIGKSTILLQMCGKTGENLRVLYVTGEESARQIKLRADRLSVNSNNLFVLAETDIGVIVETVLCDRPDIVIIDSIQTMYYDGSTSSPGSVSQVRECTAQLMRLAKGEGIPVLIVGHVNKEGSLAGPKVMEHMVDAVLYFEGEKQLAHRILRAVKNRYGSTNEIGVFEMGDSGLREVKNPSLMFLEGRPKNVSGTAVVCVLEGVRPILAEVQALVAATPFTSPRRMTVGIDYGRANMLIAVLEKRAGLFLSSSDVYLNVIGGLKLDEPSSDLGIVTALASAVKDFIIPEDTFIIGEVGLAGEVRAVTGIDTRISEAYRLGFKRCIVPYQNKITVKYDGLEIVRVRGIYQAIAAFA